MLKIFDKSKGNLQPISDFMADEQLKETKGKKRNMTQCLIYVCIEVVYKKLLTVGSTLQKH